MLMIYCAFIQIIINCDQASENQTYLQKHTHSHYATYLSFFVSYTNYVNYNRLLNVSCPSRKSFIDKALLTQYVATIHSLKVIKFCVHISSIYSHARSHEFIQVIQKVFFLQTNWNNSTKVKACVLKHSTRVDY